MIEDNKLYNGHTYSGIQLIACLNGYIQGRTDKYQEIVSEYMLLTEEQIKAIRTDTINEFISKFEKRTQFRKMTKSECINTMYDLAEEVRNNNEHRRKQNRDV